MKIIKVALTNNPYPICVGYNTLSQLGSKAKQLNIGQDALIVTHPRIEKLYAKDVVKGLKQRNISVKVLTVPEGEKSKSAQVAFGLIEKIARYDIYKKPFIVALGGGVIGDLAGYVASAYKRGIPYIQVPTTFLAQVDSAIGGKVAIDLPVGKNLVGAFYQPKVVWTDVSVLKTLSKRQILNGLSETVKYGIIYDRNLFEYMEANVDKLLSLEMKSLEKVILRCSAIKAHIVAEDEKEKKGLRTILNFGHTIGHAIEAACQYDRYHHGEAVALGMRVAMDISHQMGLVKAEEAERGDRLLSKFGLPEKIEGLRVEKILDVMKHDKKFISGKNRFVLTTRIGQVKVIEGIPLLTIKKALKKNLF